MEWPAPWRSPDSGELASFRQVNDEACEFHEFVQWTADRQLAACRDAARRRGMPIGLYTDLAVGIHPRGADAWMQQDAVLPDISIGAPPDEFNPAGQDWGLTPFNPQALPNGDFAAMRELLDAAMRYAGAIRIDHVLGLRRLFLIPKDAPGGTYVQFPFEALLRVISEESNRHRCVVVGEDLGTVPEGLRDTLAQWGLWGCRVMLFEREWGGAFREPARYPPEAVASFNTHDLPSFRGWMEGHDLRVRQAIGVAAGESDEARKQAQAALRDALTPPGDVASVAAFLGGTPCRLATIALADILGVIDQVNIPATVTEHPNWRHKLPTALEELGHHEGLQRVADAFAQAGRSFKT